MSDYAEVTVGDHGTIYVEVTPTAQEGWREAGLGDELQKLKVSFATLMAAVRTTAQGFWDGIKDIEKKYRPDETSVEFGLTLGGEGGVAIKASGEGAFKVTLTWKHSKDKD